MPIKQTPDPAPHYLVVRLRRLGDIIVSEPVIRALKNSSPDARVDIIVQSEFAQIVKHNPDIDRVLEFDRGWDKLSFPERIASYRKFYAQLRDREYTAVIDLHSNPRSIMMAYLARTKTRIGRKKIHNLFFTHRLTALPGNVQTSRQLMHLLSPLKMDSENSEPNLFVPEQIKEQLKQRFGIRDKEFTVICPGSNKPYWTRWAPDNFARLAQYITDKHDKNVYIITGPQEGKLAQTLEYKTGKNQKIEVIENKLSQIELAGFISLAALFIGNNSGPLHMSGAIGTPSIAIYGPSLPDTWAVPDKTPHKHFYHMVGCNPCNESICAYEPRTCLAAVTVEEVCEGIDELLS